MFHLFKRRFKIVAPVSGKVIKLKDVPDEIFAEKMAGDGIAIESKDDVVLAPADGEINLIFNTNHAFGMLIDNKLEILVHIGLDTIKLGGEGFKRLVQEGDRVKAGDPIIRFDRDFILSRNCSIITPVLITNTELVEFSELNLGKVVEAGKDTVLEYKLLK